MRKNTIGLTEGEAHSMGEGTYVILQRDEHGRAQSVVVSREDLERLLAAGS